MSEITPDLSSYPHYPSNSHSHVQPSEPQSKRLPVWVIIYNGLTFVCGLLMMAVVRFTYSCYENTSDTTGEGSWGLWGSVLLLEALAPIYLVFFAAMTIISLVYIRHRLNWVMTLPLYIFPVVILHTWHFFENLHSTL